MNSDDYILRLEPPLRELCSQLQSIVVGVLPEVQKAIKWGVPTYSLNNNICSIMAHKKHVNLQLFQGAHIKDAHELAGTGKNMRHLKVA